MKKTVLLVADDNPDDVMLLDRALRRMGSSFEVVHVINGDELIAYVQGRGAFGDRSVHPSPKIVLLDLKMPGTDGFAVLRWRRETPDGYRMPVVVFTSSALPQDIDLAYGLGANSYVVKPTAPERLDVMVAALTQWWSEFNASLTPSFST